MLEANRATTIAFVDDHPTLLRGIASLFESDPGYAIVGTGTSANDAIRLVEQFRPEILVLDLSMPGNVFAALQEVAGSGETRIIVFTAYANVDMAMRALDAGANAFVLKGRPTQDLYDAITTVQGGEMFVSPDFSATLMSGYRHRSRRKDTEVQLSEREKQIVGRLLKGKTNKEIARDLQLSEKTIKHYMTNLMQKLNVRSRLEVVIAAQGMRQPQALTGMEPSPEKVSER